MPLYCTKVKVLRQNTWSRSSFVKQLSQICCMLNICLQVGLSRQLYTRSPKAWPRFGAHHRKGKVGVHKIADIPQADKTKYSEEHAEFIFKMAKNRSHTNTKIFKKHWAKCFVFVCNIREEVLAYSFNENSMRFNKEMSFSELMLPMMSVII